MLVSQQYKKSRHLKQFLTTASKRWNCVTALIVYTSLLLLIALVDHCILLEIFQHCFGNSGTILNCFLFSALLHSTCLSPWICAQGMNLLTSFWAWYNGGFHVSFDCTLDRKHHLHYRQLIFIIADNYPVTKFLTYCKQKYSASVK